MPAAPPKPPTNEIGHVATAGAVAGPGGTMLAGTILDPAEETAAWQWPQSIRTADTLIKNSQVQAVMWAVTLPIRRPSIWALDPRRASEEVTRFVAEDLDLPILGDDQPKTPPARSKGRLSWVDHMRLALLDLRYGAMAFQQVYTEPDAAGRFHLRKLSPRLPHTWASVDVEPDGSLKGISQWRLAHEPGKPSTIPIPVDWLVLYVNEREGANWLGRSILRSAYGDFVLLDRQVRVRAQTNERNGMGVPIFEPDKDSTPTQAQLDAAAEMAQAYRAGEFSGGAGIPGFHFRVVGVEGTLPDIGAAISDHRTQIARSVLAHVMQLGLSADSSGNRALGQTFLEQFTMALDTLAGAKADTATAHIVEDIVDVNWGPDEPAPAVVALPVDAERDLSADSLAALVRDGVIEPDDELEGFTRQRFRIPRRSTPRRDLAPTPVAAGRRVAASAPGAEPFAERLTSHYAPKIADALAESTDVDAIVAALEGDGA